MQFSAAGSNWGDGTSGPPMFAFAQVITPLLSWMMLGPNRTACPPVSADLYQAWYNYNKKGCFDSEKFMCYIQHCVISVQRNISPLRWSVIIIDEVNTHISHETIKRVQCVFNVFYIQVTDIPTPNANSTFYWFVMFCKVHNNTRSLPDAPSGSGFLRSWLDHPTQHVCYNPKTSSSSSC